MKRSASTRFAAAEKRKSRSGNSITSLDGTQTISWDEFERLFEEGSDDIDAFIDWDNTTGHGGRREGSGRKPSGKKTYQIRLRPATHQRLKSLARKRKMAISDYLESLILQ